MKTLLKTICLASALLIISACGSKVEVPPASVGKILGKNGYLPETVMPSKFRLDACFAYCEKLVILEVNDNTLYENLTVFMPNDKLNLAVDIRGTFSIDSTEKVINNLFNRVVAAPHPKSSSMSLISALSVYEIYGKQAVRGIVRSEITKYSIQEILESREAISTNIHAAIAKKLEATGTPLRISRFELADVQPPKVITAAQESAKEREIDIQRAEADAEVELVKAARALEVAKKDRLVEREKAEAIAEQNRIAAKSITPEVLAYKKLETAENIYTALAKSDNVIIVPLDSSGFNSITDAGVLSKLLGREVRR